MKKLKVLFAALSLPVIYALASDHSPARAASAYPKEASPAGLRHLPDDSLGIGLYKGSRVVLHKVAPKETFYSIARRYNVHPRYLIRYNDHVQGLKIGDTIRIQVDSMHTFQNLVLVPDSDREASENRAAPVETPPVSTMTQHVVGSRETLFAIARKYGTTVEEIRRLNKLTGNAIKVGQSLIVAASGPIANNPGQLSAAANTPAPASAPVTVPAPQGNTAASQAPESNTQASSGSAASVPAAAKPSASAGNEGRAPAPFGTPDRMAERERERRGKDDAMLVKEMRESGVATWTSNASLNQAKSVALHKTAPSGTIVKVTNPANRKSIMVKVVGGFPDNAETENAIIVISQSAAQLLGVQQNRFPVNLSYAILQ